MAEVTLEGVWKIYEGDVEAVRDVSIAIPDGAFCVLVGPSGCGKSTTLRMIAGLEEITRGAVSIGGRVVNDVAPKDRDIAMVFQNYALYPHMSVEKNLSFALRLRGIKKDEISRRVGHAAEMLGLTELLHRRPGALSGGQRQRVALGRAMVREPAAFLFDEPLSNLDAKLRGSTRSELKALHRRLGATTVYVTHDQEEAMSLGDMIVVMAGGVVQQTGTPLDVFDRPANRFVAGFIGTPPMNFIRGSLARADDGRSWIFTERHGAATLRVPADEATEPASDAVLGVRPQAVHEIKDDNEHRACAESGRLLTVRVHMVEPLGEQMDVHATIGPDTPAVFRVPHHAGLDQSKPIDLAVDTPRLRLFEPGEFGASLSAAAQGSALTGAGQEL
ncbi:MAG: sn-glycerol-3-phosphate ABC transporter ATP-binding protein UgpC [Phycisphaeraceae bacterium]|nr:MAG: sn-glycerol-3-phosphate ABC transporter ATP-binding protein UgpC [Phycisphaeraceae bacterium]